jgi:hypothetical protein
VWKIKQNEKEKFKKDKIFTNPKYFKSEEGERKKKTKLFKTLCNESLSFSQKRKDTHTLKTHAHALLLRKEGNDEGRV